MKHLIKSFIFVLMMIVLPMSLVPNRLSFAADTTKTYYTVYDGETKNNVLFLKGDDVNVGDKYLSKDNNLYEIVKVDDSEKIAYTKFLRKEELPKFNVKAKQSAVANSNKKSGLKLASVYNVKALNSTDAINIAYAKANKKVGLYHTHNDESYFTPDGVDSVYGKGGIHDVGKAIKDNLTKLGVEVNYREDLHLPHNSGAYTRSQVTAVALLDSGVDAIFDIHRDSTKRSEYLTTVNGEKMSSVRMVIGVASANYEENKNFAYTIKGYADEVYPGFIKDIYIGKGNYNQQLTPRAMLFEMGCENIEKDLVIKSTSNLAKIIDVVLYGTKDASDLSLSDVDLVSDNGETSVITGIVNSSSNGDKVNSNHTLWVVLGMIGVVLLVLGIVLICSKKARYKIGRFFSEMFAGIFGKKKTH